MNEEEFLKKTFVEVLSTILGLLFSVVVLLTLVYLFTLEGVQ